MREPRPVPRIQRNLFPTAETRAAGARQAIVDQLRLILNSTKAVGSLPMWILLAVEGEIWKHPRQTPDGGGIIPPIDLDQFVTSPYPYGLNTTFEVIEKFIAGNEAAMLAWDRARRGEHGGLREGAGRPPSKLLEPPREPPEIKPDNIRLEGSDPPRSRPLDYGTSVDAGLRRLDKAAQAGDARAAELLRRVLDKDDSLSVNAACILMGWRKPTLTVVDNTDALAAAAARKEGPLAALKCLWENASPVEREEMRAWINEQNSSAGDN